MYPPGACLWHHPPLLSPCQGCTSQNHLQHALPRSLPQILFKSTKLDAYQCSGKVLSSTILIPLLASPAPVKKVYMLCSFIPLPLEEVSVLSSSWVFFSEFLWPFLVLVLHMSVFRITLCWASFKKKSTVIEVIISFFRKGNKIDKMFWRLIIEDVKWSGDTLNYWGSRFALIRISVPATQGSWLV